MSSNNRPMSPHLDIYKWRVTMLTSILHRAAGAVVSLGLFVLVCKLCSLAFGGAQSFAPTGMLFNAFWFVWTLAVYYHMSNGIRHLVWDSGKGFDVKQAERSAKMVLISAVVLTIVTWIAIEV